MRSIFQKLGKPPSNLNVKPDAETVTENFHIKLETPMVGGGFEAGKSDPRKPVRASEVRGNLRYWWRTMNWNDPEMPNNETKIWGSTDTCSSVSVDVINVSSFQEREYVNDKEAYALSVASKDRNKPNSGSIAKEGMTFTLSVTYPKRFERDIKLALSAWIYFGGIGARTRRGCGSISCSENIMSVKEVLKANPTITMWKKPARNGMDAWTEILDIYRKYRQNRNKGTTKKYGRSRWPEPDSLRKITGRSTPEHKNPILPGELLPSFPRAALGLPIVFHFPARGEPPDVMLIPKGYKRMSSPVITKAICEKGIWYSAVVILPHEHVFDLKLDMEGAKFNAAENLPLKSEKYKRVSPMVGADNAISGFEEVIRGDFKKESVI